MEKAFIIKRFDKDGNICGYLYRIGEYQPNHTARVMGWTKKKERAMCIVHEHPYISKEFGACIRIEPRTYNYAIIEVK